MSDMDWISFGKLARTHGLKGELKFFPNDPEEIESLLGQAVRVKKKQLKMRLKLILLNQQPRLQILARNLYNFFLMEV